MIHHDRSKLRYLNHVYALLLSLFVLTSYLSLTPPDEEQYLYLMLAVAFWTIAMLRDSPASRMAQVVLLTVTGLLVTLRITPELMGGDLTVMVATMLAYRYGFLRNKPLRRSFLLLGPLIVVRIAAFFLYDAVQIHTLINQLAIDAAAAPLLYFIFEDELIRNRRHRRELQRLHAENAPFAQFGRNTSGIVHDFKNDLSLFSTFGQLLELNAGEPVDEALIQKYKSYVERFRQRIGRILFVSRAGQIGRTDRWNLRDALEATMYVFESNLAYKKLVTFQMKLPEEELFLTGQIFCFFSIVENLVQNSCQAIAESGRSGTVLVSVEAFEKHVTMTITDDGPGLPICDGCTSRDCAHCERLQSGQSSKEDGTGLGLGNVRHAVHQLGADLSFRSETGRGVSCQVTIPLSAECRATDPARLSE